jgi:uncharacterized membrane protein
LSSRDGTRLAALALLGLAGLGVSAYLTVVHASLAPLACSASGVVDCERVLTSPFAEILGSGVPTSAAGLLWFATAVALVLVEWRHPFSTLLARLHLAWVAAGMLTVLFLVYVEIVRLGTICAWCTAAHVLVLFSFLMVLPRWMEVEAAQDAILDSTGSTAD